MQKFLIVSTFLLLPSFTLAIQAPTDFRGLVDIFLDLIDLIIPLIFALTFIVLIWGIAKAWILNIGDKEEIEKGKKLVIAGVIGLVVMSGIWGILSILRYSFFGI